MNLSINTTFDRFSLGLRTHSSKATMTFLLLLFTIFVVAVAAVFNLAVFFLDYYDTPDGAWRAYLQVVCSFVAVAVSLSFLVSYRSFLNAISEEKKESTAGMADGLINNIVGHREEIRKIRARLEEVEQTERKRLASELHDEVGQNLTALSLNLNALLPRLSVQGEIEVRLNDSLKLLEDTTARIRGVMADLRPPGLDEYGLSGAVSWFSEQFRNRSGIRLNAVVDLKDPRPSPAVERAFFRIAQETLNNIARHSGARNASLMLGGYGGNLRMLICDDGCGFDSEKVGGSSAARWGLKIMRERAEMMGASLKIESNEGSGTRVSVEIVHEAEND